MNKESQKTVKIYALITNPTVEFAVLELKKYLDRMMPGIKVEVNLETVKYGAGAEGFYLGRFHDFGMKQPNIENPELDDAFLIDVSGLNGIIAGSNFRSILLAVYRYLEETGCRWVRHGADGEYIPQSDLTEVGVKLEDKASYRHRGLCIEGAVSYENMLDNIDWAPKLGFNSYFLEFFTPYTFFDRWYSHKNNKYKKPLSISVEKVKEFTACLEKEIKKRGLIYHAVGHGWTCEPLGIPGLEWEPVQYEISADIAQLFAEVKGKRVLRNNIPLNTNLCYSNPEARRRMVEYAADYAEKNPHVNMLHIWLADESDNHCECENCRNTRPSDYYVMILNEMDAELTRRGLETKLIFLLYLDLLWAPSNVKFVNPDRFLLLFAPITRTYSRTYDTDTEGVTLGPFVRNKQQFPTNVRENIAYLKEWQKIFKGDSFAYEYHFMWDHFNDPGYYRMAEILSQDIKNLRKIGINGIVSDQTQRSFFPTGFGMYILGKTLWNEALDFDRAAREYFQSAFGEDGQLCREYMATLSELFDPAFIRGEKLSTGNSAQEVFGLWSLKHDRQEVDSTILEKLGKIPGVVNMFRPVIERNLVGGDPCKVKSWEYLQYHADIVTMLSQAFKVREEGAREKALELWGQVADIVQFNEDILQSVLDVYEFIWVLEKKFQ
jgi:hypothetical protein